MELHRKAVFLCDEIMIMCDSSVLQIKHFSIIRSHSLFWGALQRRRRRRRLSRAHRFKVLGSGPSQAYRTFHIYGLGELVPELPWKNGALICPPADQYHSLYRLNTPSGCLYDIP